MEARHAHASRKRKLRNVDDEAWDCSVCTYKNSPGAFRCEMCQTRKGTSTRKPKLNPQIVEEQSFIARAIIKEREEEQGLRKRREQRSSGGGTANAAGGGNGGGGTGANGGGGGGGSAGGGGGGGGMLKGAAATAAHALLPSLCNVDRSSPLLFEIFANGYSVVITEYQPKVTAARSFTSVADSPVPSNSSSLLGFTSTPLGVNSGQMSPAEQPQPSTRGGCQFADFPEVDNSFGYGTASRSAIGSRTMNPSPSSCETGAGEETEGVHVKSDQPPLPSRRSNFTHHSVAPASTADLKPFTFSASSSTSSASSTSSSVPYPTPPQEDRLHECPLPATEGSGKTEALVTPKPSGGHPKSDVQMTPAPVHSCPSTFRGTKGRLKRRLPHSISDATDSASTPMEQAEEGEADVKAAPSWTARSRTKQRRFSTPKSLHVSPSFSRLVSPRSLRSHLGSNTRQASRVAQASLYQNTDQLRPPRAAHKRRKLLGSSLSGAASARRSAAGSGGPQKNTPAKPQPSSTPPGSASPKAAKQEEEEEPSALPTPACQSTAVSAETGEKVSKDLAPSATATVVTAAATTTTTTTSKTITVNGCPSTESSKNTTAMTDSCGALTLEMSAV